MNEFEDSKHFIEVPNTAAPPVRDENIQVATYDECCERISEIIKNDGEMYAGYTTGCLFNQRVEKSSYILELIVKNYINAAKKTLSKLPSKEEITIKTNQLNAIEECLITQFRLLDSFNFKLDVKLVSSIIYGVLQVQLKNHIKHD